MSDPGPHSAQGGVPTPFGSLEFNVFVAGLEASFWILTLRATVVDSAIVQVPPADWRWWYGAALALGVVGLFVLGLAVEGLAGMLEVRLTRKKDGSLKDWYRTATEYPGKGWTDAQRWIWESPQAAAEFGRRRVRILVARNTAFNLAAVTLCLAIYFVVRQPRGWPGALIATAALGLAFTRLFVYVWTEAHKAWHRAVRDAGKVGQRS